MASSAEPNWDRLLELAADAGLFVLVHLIVVLAEDMAELFVGFAEPCEVG